MRTELGRKVYRDLDQFLAMYHGAPQNPDISEPPKKRTRRGKGKKRVDQRDRAPHVFYDEQAADFSSEMD